MGVESVRLILDFRIEKPHIKKKHVDQRPFIKWCLPVCLCHQCAACFGQCQMTAAFVCMDSTFSLSVSCVSSGMFIPTGQMTSHLKNKVRRLCWVKYCKYFHGCRRHSFILRKVALHLSAWLHGTWSCVVVDLLEGFAEASWGGAREAVGA